MEDKKRKKRRNVPAPVVEATRPSPPVRPLGPDEAEIPPEHPGNIPAGTSANPAKWGDAYDPDQRPETGGRRRPVKSP